MQQMHMQVQPGTRAATGLAIAGTRTARHRFAGSWEVIDLVRAWKGAVAILAVLVISACDNTVAPGEPAPSPPRFLVSTVDPALACSAPIVVDLLADRDLRVGTVRAQHNSKTLYVTYQTVDGWTLDRTALSVTTDAAGIPTSGGGNPTVGRFPYGANHGGGTTSFSYEVPLDGLGPTGSAVVAAHAQVRNGKRTEGAWAAGEPIRAGGNWATRFSVSIGDCATQPVGGAGGTVTFHGVELQVPAGALFDDVDITVTPVDLNDLEPSSTTATSQSAAGLSAFNLPSTLEPAAPVLIGGVLGFQGTAYDFGPDGLIFDTPARITIQYDEAAVSAAGIQEDQLSVFLLNGIFVQLESVVDTENNTVSALVEHFSTFFVGINLADLEVSALYEPDAARVGVPVQFGADIHNLGPGSTNGATFTWVAFGDVTLDGVFGLCTEIEAHDLIFGDVGVRCPVPSLAPGATTGVPVLRITPYSVGDVTVWATVTAPTGTLDSDLANNRLTATAAVEPAVVADLITSRLGEPTGPAKVGTVLEYSADVANLGPDAVTGATFTWVAFGDVTLDGLFGLCTEIEPHDLIFGDVGVRCPVLPLASGATTGVPVLRITPQSVGGITVWATITAPSGALDPDIFNNRLAATAQVEPTVVADLITSHLGEPAGPAKVGTVLEYSADVANLGPDAVTGATFTWVAFGDVTLDGVFGLCTEIDPFDLIFGDVGVRCPVLPLALGATTGVPVLRITPQSIGEITVWATITAPAGALDPDTDNNRLTATAQVEPSEIVADLRVVNARLLNPPAVTGKELEYAADIENLGPDAVNLAIFEWTVRYGDGGLGEVPASCSATVDTNLGLAVVGCPVGPIGVGNSVAVPILRVTAIGGIAVHARVIPTEAVTDPDPSNNFQSVPTIFE